VENREPDGVYQGGKMVARASGVEVDLESKQIHFAELANSEYLLLPDECEYGDYRLQMKKVGFASREEKGALHKGRILRDVTAEILGYGRQ
jgi:hypothetical protein